MIIINYQSNNRQLQVIAGYDAHPNDQLTDLQPPDWDWVVPTITVISEWARWSLKSPASRLFTEPFIQAQIKENIKVPRRWPLWGEFTGDRWIPRTKASNAEFFSIWWRHHV